MLQVKTFLKNNWISVLTYVFIVIYTIAASTVALLRYWQFENFYFDFGIFDRAIWLVSHLKPPFVYHPNFHGIEKIIFADHFNPSMFLLSPLYWFTNKREVLLIFQTIVVSLSAAMGYIISKGLIKNRLLRFALIVAYLGYVGIQNALISDIHDATLATFPLMVIFWAVMRKKWIVFYLCLFLVLGLKETFAGIGVSMGLFLLLLNKNFWKHAVATTIISVVWFYVAVYKVIPYFSGEQYFYLTSTIQVHSLKDLVGVFISPVIKVKTVLFSLLTFGFLPLLFVPLFPGIIENFFERFASVADTRWGLALHYNATLAVFLFMSALYAVRMLEKKELPQKLLTSIGIGLIAIVILLHRFILHGPLALAYNTTFYTQTGNSAYIEKFIVQIPLGRRVMTQNNIAVRLTREDVVLLDLNYPQFDPDVIAFNLTPGQNPNNYFPLTEDKTNILLSKLQKDAHFFVKQHGKYLYIFEKKGLKYY